MLLRWTRDRILTLPSLAHETFEQLVFAPSVRERLQKTIETVQRGPEEFHALRLSWRRGLFFFGPAGTGKSAAARALSEALTWEHFLIPAHEILDSHLLEHALADAVSKRERVIVLEDVDLMVKRMEPEVFFTLIDHAMARAEATVWISTTRHPEDVPKTQLIRPGRFDEAIRFDLPAAALRREILAGFLGAADGAQAAESDPLTELVEKTEGLSFAHLDEIRQIFAQLKLEDRTSAAFDSIRAYVDDQIVSGDRMGGLSDVTAHLMQRVSEVDPRVLLAALDMTDVFRRLMEKVIADAAEEAKKTQAEEGAEV